MICKECTDSQLNYNTGGNNNIISLLLIKYTLKQLNCFMKIILMIIKREKNYYCENNELYNFSFIDSGLTFRIDHFIELKIEEINNFILVKDKGELIDHKKENEYFWLLKSLFIISLIYDQRIKLFIFGDHSKLLSISDLISPKIDINLFLLKCNEFINDFKNNQIQLYDIGFHISNEWKDLGLYIM